MHVESLASALPGYEHFVDGGASVVVLREHMPAVRAVLAGTTLYDYAARHPLARPLKGRAIAFAAPLPDDTRVVVRHNRHGGLLAPMTGDLFLPPTRAPLELAVSRRLTACGVPTPEIVAYAVYRAGPIFRRSDVASREILGGSDLAEILIDGDAQTRRAALDATAILIGRLSRCGARHHDLNVKNVLLTRLPGFNAYVLDVDRVEFGTAGDPRIIERNLERFLRSARKWREHYGARVDDADLAALVASARRWTSSGESSGDRASTRS